jgi:hypothetical protein
MNSNTPLTFTDGVFARNMTALIGDNHTITSLSRDLNIHRNQIQRFVDGVSVPKPETLRRICQFFDVDARILTHHLDDVYKIQSHELPWFLIDAMDPVSQELLPDGFYEEWRELHASSKQFVCVIYYVSTIAGIRRTKVIVNNLIILQDGTPTELDSRSTYRGIAVRQAGGLCIIDRSDHDTGLTFTALRFGPYGNAGLFAGHKRSVLGVIGRGPMKKSATVLRKIEGGFREAMQLRRLPRFRTSDEAPEVVQWLLKEQQITAEFG